MEEQPICMSMFLQNFSSVLAFPFCKMARYYGFREIQLMQVFGDHKMNNQEKNYGNVGRLEGHIDALRHFEHCKCFFCNSYSLLRSRDFLKCPGRKCNYMHAWPTHPCHLPDWYVYYSILRTNIIL